jgi:hypothetical protein
LDLADFPQFFVLLLPICPSPVRRFSFGWMSLKLTVWLVSSSSNTSSVAAANQPKQNE